MEKLPERWAVERTPENYEKVNGWANANLPYPPYFHEHGFVQSDGNVNGSLGLFELITSAQFMRLLYNPWKQAQNGKASIEERFMQACEILELLVKCKSIHDNPNATVEERKFYDKNKPIAWMMAKAFLTK